MSIDLSSTSGLIRLGKLAFLWSNPDERFGFSGYSCISYGNTSLEFGDIDAGNGIFLVKYVNGELAYHRALLKIN